MQYSIVVPIYRDGSLAEDLCVEVQRVMRGFTGREDIGSVVELIFVNDGSPDNSLELLLDLRSKYDFIHIIDLSRNFGQHIAIACGFREATGNIIMRMNVDMQDHPDQIPVLLEHMTSTKADIVIGQYEQRESPLINRLTARLYYSFFRLMTGLASPQNTSPLRVMSRRYITAYNSLTEKTRFPQGLDQWLGFYPRYVLIAHRPRAKGKSSYNFWLRLRLGLDGLLYFSERPLVIMMSLGLVLSAFGTAMGLALVVMRLFLRNIEPGYTSLAAIGLFAFGVQLICLGVVGFYVGKIFKEVQNRPLYIIKDRFWK
jgi:glycosyltransferase involved in cell wall biosynthesis